MIALDRLLDDIDRQFLAPRLVEKSLQLLLDQRSIRQGDLEKHAFQSSVWKKAKPQLLLESHNKCAYCESPTAVVAFGDVEHFRPKSVYWWWAYCLDNFLASCAICNQKFKSDKFPLLGRRLRGPLVR
ncbi:MAG: hypothetical protein KJO55_02575, partial [Gammaproteobacteria bacterium]|nr:hypothetical protein [Gammaproteobacteria bacterium]